jgi:hypothetical protein
MIEQYLRDNPGCQLLFGLCPSTSNSPSRVSGSFRSVQHLDLFLVLRGQYRRSMRGTADSNADQSRNNPRNAPLTIWLAGGPGEASSFSAMTENGPCYVNQYSNDTILNPHSLNEHSNVLYIDQPVQAGFSYSTFMNSTFNFVNPSPYVPSITPVDAYNGDFPAENSTFKYGIWADQNPSHTANTTQNAMKPLWQFLQSWLEK